MGVYSKDNAGNIKQIAGNIVQRLNTRWFLCTRSIENDIEYYTVPASAQDYFKTIDSYTLYSLGFNEPNTTKYPVLRYGNIELDILDFTTEDGSINIGQLMGVFQMFTQDLSTDPKMYFVGNTHKDIDTGVSQEDFDALVNNETQIQNIEKPNLLLIGGATKVGTNNAGIGIGKNAQVQAAGNIAIGENAKTVNYGSVSIGADSSSTGGISLGNAAKSGGTDAIQLGHGTNNTPNSFQVNNDNIYKTSTHTLTVQNAEINGAPAYGVLSGTSAPTTTTVGAVGQFYLDTTNKQLYQCVSVQTQTVDEVDTTIYEWQEVGSGNEKKYMHCLAVKGFSTPKVFMNIVTNSNSPITSIDEIKSWLIDNGYVYDDSVNIYNVVGYPVTGGWYTGTSRHFYDTAFVDTVATNPVTYRLCVRQITIGVTELLVDDVNYYTVNNSEPFTVSKYAGGGFNKSKVSDNVIEL